jgi:hypothetical protein
VRRSGRHIGGERTGTAMRPKALAEGGINRDSRGRLSITGWPSNSATM